MATKLLTGNMARASLPHDQDGDKASDKFGAFTSDSLTMIVNAFTVADGIEAELIAKVAFGIVTQRMAVIFNPALKEAGLDQKFFKVAAIAAMVMTGRPVFKNQTMISPTSLTHEDTMEWVAKNYARGFRFLNRIEARWRMGAKVAIAAYKMRAVVATCLQAKSQQAGLVAFIGATRDLVDTVMREVKVAKAAAKAQPDVVKQVTGYLENKNLNSADLAAVIGHLNTLHAAAVNIEAAAMARADGEGEEEEMDEAA